MRHRIYLLVLFLPAFLWAAPASADSACAAGNLSSMIGTSCDIGPLRLTLTSIFAESSTSNINTGQVSSDVLYSASNFYLTPTSNGFTLTFLNGPQSLTSTQGYHSGEDIFLSYSLTMLDPGQVVTGESVSAGLAATGNKSYSSASVSGWTAAPYFSQIYGGTSVNDSLGSITTSPFIYYPNGGANNELWPGSSDPGVVCLVLGADNGNSAYWSGSMNVSFSTSPVPEPSSLLMLGFASILGVPLVLLTNKIRSASSS